MRIWLDQVREAPFDWEETETVAVEALERPELLGLAPVVWRGQVLFCDPGFMLRARLTYEQTLACIRCLKPLTVPTESEVELAIEAVEHRPGRAVAGERTLLEEDMGVLVVDGRVLETTPILLEQLQLNIPMKPLCRPDCKGLCPECGADLNAGACDCVQETKDPRWAALTALRGGNENDRGGGSGSA